MSPAPGLFAALALSLAVTGCSKRREEPPAVRPPPASRDSRDAGAPSAGLRGPPALLYLPDAEAPPLLPGPGPAVALPFVRSGACPPDMVLVSSAFCIDRYESTLVDAVTGKRLSPYYHPTRDATLREYSRWQRLRNEAPAGPARDMPVPEPPEWEVAARRLEPLSTSVPGSEPNGYLSGEIAERVCKRAGKRLCTAEEWVVACRGQGNRQFPYGQTYEEGRCNVFRAVHPAGLLHGDASEGHLDPRLNLVRDTDGRPLLRRTGDTPSCKSEWGADGVFDMVGNLDEWVEDPSGTFVGGFYSRATNRGCDARVEVHDYDYYDYSLGARCCRGRQ